MTYSEWIARYATLTARDREALAREVRMFIQQPLISILIPIYNPDLQFLEAAIESVRRQLYPRWELCLADDHSSGDRVRAFVEALSQKEPRCRYVLREKNGGIAACTNSALALATGEWCGLLDQDDLLAENALAEVASAIVHHPEVQLIYSDEDFVDAAGERTNPFFKSDWNPELFLAQNYLNHLGVYRTSLLHDIGGFREGFEGSQDYDLALRCVARLGPEQIRHIPKVLYHWRMIEGSLAHEPNAKPHARHAARRALNDYFARSEIGARAEACSENDESHRVIYSLPAVRPKVTILFGSKDEDVFRRENDYPEIEIIPAEPGAVGANLAAQEANGEILVFVGANVCQAEDGWLRELVSHVLRPEVGAAGGRLCSSTGSVLDGGLILGLGGIAAPAFFGFPRSHPGYFNRGVLQQNLSAVSVACLAVRRDVFKRLGGFDADSLPCHFYDIDFCLRLLLLKLQVIWTPYANLVLSSDAASETFPSSEETNYMQERWGNELQHDPFYNRNLSLEPPGFVLATPPRPECG
ncbi:MAG TPA: glycosyltransferase [Chthoniobacterales bacterium]|jgi:GT2 family glycosyltransferase